MMFPQGRRAINREARQPMLQVGAGGDMRMAGALRMQCSRPAATGRAHPPEPATPTAQGQGKQPHRVWRGRTGGGGGGEA